MNTAWSKPTKYVVGVSLAILGVFVLYISRSVIPILIISALIAMILRPLIQRLHSRAHLSRGLAVVIVYLSTAVVVPLALLLAVPAIIRAVHYVISLDYLTILQGAVEWLRAWLLSIKTAQIPVGSLDTYTDQLIDSLLIELQGVTTTTVPAPPPVDTILQSIGTALTATFGAATGLVGAVVSKITLFIFMFLTSIYMSLGAHTYREAFLRALPDAYQPEIGKLLSRISQMWNAFFRGQLTLMLVIGVMSWLGLTILGVPGALYLGIIAGLLEILPNLGPIIATIPAVIVALLQGSNYLPISNPVFALVIIAFYILVQQLENSLIVPRVLGDAVELPPLVVMTGVLIGATTGGILGALLATPIIATGREILRYVYRKLQGEDPFPPGEEVAPDAERSSPATLAALRGRVERLLLSRRLAARSLRKPAAPAPENSPAAPGENLPPEI